MAKKTHGDLAADAAAYLARSTQPTNCFGEDPLRMRLPFSMLAPTIS
jgi:hypothetical protein